MNKIIKRRRLVLKPIKQKQNKSLKQKEFEREVKQIQVAIDNETYRFKRYKIEFSLAVFFSKSSVFPENFGPLVRQTDVVVKLDENRFVIAFCCVNHSSAHKAVQNLQHSLLGTHNIIDVQVAMTDIYSVRENECIVKKLFLIFDHPDSFKHHSLETETVLINRPACNISY